MTTTPAALTDTEWREFQAIPDQGYSHRGWVDRKIAERVRAAALAARAEAIREAAEHLRGIRHQTWNAGERRPSNYARAADDLGRYAIEVEQETTRHMDMARLIIDEAGR